MLVTVAAIATASTTAAATAITAAAITPAAAAAAVVTVLVFVFVFVFIVALLVFVLILFLVVVIVVAVLGAGGRQDGAGLAGDGELREAELLGLRLGARHAEEWEQQDRGEDRHAERRGSHAQPKPRAPGRPLARSLSTGGASARGINPFLQRSNVVGVRCMVDGCRPRLYIYTYAWTDLIDVLCVCVCVR